MGCTCADVWHVADAITRARESEFVCVCACACVCVCERESERVCVRVRERVCVCVLTCADVWDAADALTRCPTIPLGP